MQQPKIEWLHRLGIDVWLPRISTETFQNLPIQRAEQTELVSEGKGARSKTALLTRQHRTQEKLDIGATHARQPHSQYSHPKSSEDLFLTIEEESPKSIGHDNEEKPVSLQVRCFTDGRVLAVDDDSNPIPHSMYLDIVRALTRCHISDLHELRFRWPATQNPSERIVSHGGVLEARRAFASFARNQKCDVEVLLIVGSDVDSLTQDFQESVNSIIQLDRAPSDVASKRDLWNKIQATY